MLRATQINYEYLLPYAIQAYTEVFGEEYHDIISDKINRAIIIPYDDINGLEQYIEFRQDWMRLKLIIELLQEIGINVTPLENRFDSMDKNSLDIINTLFGDVSWCFDFVMEGLLPIQEFKNDINIKIKLINFFLEDKGPQITKETLEEFSTTPEYNEILSKIYKINKMYNDFSKEYSRWEKAFCEEDLLFVRKEKTRKKELLNKIRTQVWEGIFPLLPSALKEKLSNEMPEKQIDIVLSHYILGEGFLIEWFDQEKMDKLLSPTVPIKEKRTIVLMHRKFLRNLGIKPTMNLYGDEFEKNLNSYIEFLEQEDIKQFIPSNEVIESIKKAREEKDKIVMKLLTESREDFNNAWKIFDYNDEVYDALADNINQKLVCVTHSYSGNTLIPIVFYTIRTAEGGKLAYTFMHETGHVISRGQILSGFDLYEVDKNPYDNAYRKYERFNETVTDIFTIEALKSLNKKNIFLLESKEITELNYDFENTSFITQNLLKPLIRNFRKQVVKAYISSQPQVLINCIGENNFEDLVDVVNKVDSLTRNGLTQEKIEKEPKDTMVIEYNEQLKRIKRIYADIDDYYADYCDALEEVEQKQNS